MSDRLAKLLEFNVKDPDDPFTRYAIGLEYFVKNDFTTALEWFMGLIEKHPDYIGSYYQTGRCLELLNRMDEAANVYRAGIRMAEKAGNQHTKAELQSALMKIELGDEW